MGASSAKAQNLPAIITTLSRIITSDHRLYIYTEDALVKGILKMGRKKLFHRDMIGGIAEINPYCCLDFYVHESCQREGIGRRLFEESFKVFYNSLFIILLYFIY